MPLAGARSCAPVSHLPAPGAHIMKPTFLIFDTETTGLPPRAPRGTPPIAADDPRQPRMASFAGIIADEHGRALHRQKFYVRPQGWTMAEFDERARHEGKTPASAINGLTDDFLNANGVPVADALTFYSEYIKLGLTVVAFNAIFDTKIMRGELRRAGMADLFDQTRNICAMKALDAYAADGLCMSSPGFVKLSVACEFFGIVNENAHDAMADAEAARAITEILIRDDRLPLPTVVYSKHRAA